MFFRERIKYSTHFSPRCRCLVQDGLKHPHRRVGVSVVEIGLAYHAMGAAWNEQLLHIVGRGDGARNGHDDICVLAKEQEERSGESRVVSRESENIPARDSRLVTRDYS